MTEIIFKITEAGQPSREERIRVGMKIGRDPRCDIVIMDPNSSGRHAQIVAEGEGVAIQDLGSSNKTRIEDGPALSKGEQHRLGHGLKLMLGKCAIEVIMKPSAKNAKTEKAAAPRGTKTEPQPIHPYGEAAAQTQTPIDEAKDDATQLSKPESVTPQQPKPESVTPAPLAPKVPDESVTEAQESPVSDAPQPVKEKTTEAQQTIPSAPEKVAATEEPTEAQKVVVPPKPQAPDEPATEKTETPKADEASEKPAPKAKKASLPEIPPMKAGTKEPKEFTVNRYEIDLSTYTVKHIPFQCEDLEDVLGGAARGFKILENYDVDDAYAPEAPLVLNLGCLSGSQFMTALRTYFHAYSPLKSSLENKPSAMWTAGSGKFGTKLRSLGIDEVIFKGRAVMPVYLHIHLEDGATEPTFTFENGRHLQDKPANEKIQHLYSKYPEGQFAVVGPAGENYDSVNYAAIALSTMNQLRSGDMKSRFCGRGGIGGVMGSKNLLGIVADVKDPKKEKVDGLKEMNQWVARGEGSRRFRDKKKGDGGGGTWANMIALDPLNAMPEYNFNPTGTEVSRQLWREEVEKEGKYLIKDEACYACGIACHKNMYTNEDGKKGKYHAKFDYEPLNLLSSNIGIYDIGEAAVLVELVDDLCMDSISIGVTLAYAMEYNKRRKDAELSSILPDYIEYGNFEGTKRAIEEIGRGKLPVLGQGTKRLSEALGETDYAMHCKGMEFPAYMPHVNPGYPWALAGGHMSMKTYLLYVFEKESGMDYWVDAITKRGPMIMRDDLIGVCKFAAMCDEHMTMALGALSDLKITEEELQRVVMRTFLRGYRLEKKQGFTDLDYAMPADALKKQEHMKMEHFNTPEFFAELQGKVTETLDKMLIEEGI